MNAVQKLLRRSPRSAAPRASSSAVPAGGSMNGATLDSAVNAKEKLLEQLPHWTEAQAARALAAAEGEAVPAEPVVGDIRDNPLVPESMHFFDSGRPQPDWAAAVRRSRLGH